MEQEDALAVALLRVRAFFCRRGNRDHWCHPNGASVHLNHASNFRSANLNDMFDAVLLVFRWCSPTCAACGATIPAHAILSQVGTAGPATTTIIAAATTATIATLPPPSAPGAGALTDTVCLLVRDVVLSLVVVRELKTVKVNCRST